MRKRKIPMQKHRDRLTQKILFYSEKKSDCIILKIYLLTLHEYSITLKQYL